MVFIWNVQKIYRFSLMLMVHLSGKCFQSSAFEWVFQISLKYSWFQGRVTQSLFLPKSIYVSHNLRWGSWSTDAFYKNQIYYLFCFCTCGNWQTKNDGELFNHLSPLLNPLVWLCQKKLFYPASLDLLFLIFILHNSVIMFYTSVFIDIIILFTFY